MTFSFLINTDAGFAASKGGRYGSVRDKLFGKPLQHKGLRAASPSDIKPIADFGPRATKLVRRPLKTARPSKPAPTCRPHEETYVSELVRHRKPVEYLGYLITNEQQADGQWVASFVRTADGTDCAHRSDPHVASYMAFADAKRQIDAALSVPVSNRKFQRTPVALEGTIFAAGSVQPCQIMDLSAGGARLRRDNPAPLEGELFLYIKGFGRFPAHVVRCSDAEVAVRFTVDNEVVLALLKGLSNYVMGYDTPQTKLRKEVRVPTSIAAVCRMADGTAVPCEIVDASMRSMALRISERPRIGSLVTLGRTKVRVVRHLSQGIAVQCLPPSSPKSSRFAIKEE